MTYNKYLTEEAQKQSNKNNGFTVYKVRKPKADEVVGGYENTSEMFATETITERSAREGRTTEDDN